MGDAPLAAAAVAAHAAAAGEAAKKLKADDATKRAGKAGTAADRTAGGREASAPPSPATRPSRPPVGGWHLVSHKTGQGFAVPPP